MHDYFSMPFSFFHTTTPCTILLVKKIHVPHLVYMLVKMSDAPGCKQNSCNVTFLTQKKHALAWHGFSRNHYVVHLSVPFDGHSLCFSISQDTKVIPNVMSLLCRRKKFALGRGFHKESWFHAALRGICILFSISKSGLFKQVWLWMWYNKIFSFCHACFVQVLQYIFICIILLPLF